MRQRTFDRAGRHAALSAAGGALLVGLMAATACDRSGEQPAVVPPESSGVPVAVSPTSAEPAAAPHQAPAPTASAPAATPPRVAERRPARAPRRVKPLRPGKGVLGKAARPPGVVGAAEPFDGLRIAVVHTANMIGELEPCG